MEIIGAQQGANLLIGILTIIGAAIIIALAVLNKFGWVKFGKDKENGGHQMSVKELASFIEENIKVKECPAHGPMVKAHEALVSEVIEIHHQQIKNIGLHDRTSEKLNGISSEFADIKKMLASIDKKVCVLTCMMNKGKFYHNGDNKGCENGGI